MKSIVFHCFITLFFISSLLAQNSLVGDGFGGRLWYRPYNYTVGSYSGHTVCGEEASLYSWGTGPMGDTITTPPANGIYKAVGIDSVIFYTTGYIMAAITADNSGWYWDGYLSANQLLPKKIIDNVRFAEAGIDKVSFIKNDGTVWTLGNNNSGEFGNNATFNGFDTTPQKMNNINNAVRTAISGSSQLILTADGKVYTTGLRNNYLDIDSIPTQVIGLQNIIDIKAISSSYAALDNMGNVWTWGSGTLGSLGNGYDSVLTTPTIVDTLKNIIAISGSCDGFHFLALDKDSNCYAWGGFNTFGTIGNGNFADVYIPEKVADHVADIMAGETFSYIVKTDGSLWATGSSNSSGSIWLNLQDSTRFEYLKLEPTFFPFNLCPPVIFNNSKILAPNTICQGSCIDLNYVSSKNFINYAWLFDGANISSSTEKAPKNICFNTSGVYTIRLILSNNTSIDTVYKTITVTATPIAIINGIDSICVGASTLLSTATIATSYLWSNGSTNQSITITPITNTTYSLIASNGICADTTSISISVIPYPIANIIGDNYFSCNDNSIVLNSKNAAMNYLWSNGQTSKSITVTPTSSIFYTLTLSNADCRNVDSFFIDVEPDCALIFPNAFSPNNNLYNEVFLPINANSFSFENYELIILNRFGEQIFKSYNASQGWACPKCDIGTYYFICNYKLLNRPIKKIFGDITLVK